MRYRTISRPTRPIFKTGVFRYNGQTSEFKFTYEIMCRNTNYSPQIHWIKKKYHASKSQW